jgi:acyl carrier protein
VEESFYDLGGHSLLAVEIMTRLNEEFELDLPWVLLLSGAPTVASMATAVRDELANRVLDTV